MNKVLYFDYAAFIVFALILISVVMKRLTRGKMSRQFLIVLIVALVATSFDIGAIAYDNIGERHTFAQYFFHTGYLVFHVLSAALYTIYVISMVDAIHIFRGRVKSIILALPTLLCVLLLIVNLFYPTVFSIGTDGEYARERFMVFLYITSFIYMIIGFIVVMKYRRRLSRKCLISVIMIFPLVVVAAFRQVLVPEVPVEMFANSIGLLFVALLIQSPEQMISNATGLNNITRYMEDVDNVLDNGLNIGIIMISLVNDKALRGMIGVVEYHKLLRCVSDKLVAMGQSKRYNTEWYYLGNGMFRCIMDYKVADQAERFAANINSELKKGYTYNGMLINLLANICITRCPEDIDNVDAVMRFGAELSDWKYTGQIMYARDIYKKENYDLIKNLDVIIDSAFVDGRFEVYYQPIYSLSAKRYNSAEALLRLYDEKYGYVRPDIFIPAAEKSGMIHKIGKFVLEEVCRFIVSDKFKELGLDYIEVNLSVIQCMSSELADDVREIMNRYNVSSEQLNLEITETAAAYAQTTMMNNIEELNDDGIAFSLDDFGTGYSNMKRIASMPFAIVKLDKTFTEMNENDKMLKVVKNTISMVRDMNLRILVEGVETLESFKEFKALGVDYIQGYYFSKPLPMEKFVSEVKRVNMD